jgi:hypothetical protein
MANQWDHAVRLASLVVFWIQNTLPPVSRSAAASRLTLGTVAIAVWTGMGVYAGTRKPFCRSTTISAVRRGSMSSWTRSVPRRCSTRSMAHGGIVQSCMVVLPARVKR